jgi:redox-sensitive bicupin YhaK (pirin superfamily)
MVKPARPAGGDIADARMVVMAAPTSTTNMTGFFIMVRGFSLTNESRMARFTMGGSNSGRAREPFLGISVTGSATGGVMVVAI